MAAANGSGGKGFEVPKVEVRFTKLFINGQFVDAVSGTPPIIRASLSPPHFLHPSSPLVLPGDLLNERRCRRRGSSPPLQSLEGRADGEEPLTLQSKRRCMPAVL